MRRFLTPGQHFQSGHFDFRATDSFRVILKRLEESFQLYGDSS